MIITTTHSPRKECAHVTHSGSPTRPEAIAATQELDSSLSAAPVDGCNQLAGHCHRGDSDRLYGPEPPERVNRGAACHEPANQHYDYRLRIQIQPQLHPGAGWPENHVHA